MSFEIERKFLVHGDGWRLAAISHVNMRQANLTSSDKASIRVRIEDNRRAILTIKSRNAELRRLELEYDVPVLEAEAMIPLRHGSVIEKIRHDVPFGDLTWEVDAFTGESEGLVIAEVELDHAHQQIHLPPWVGTEVTHQGEYYNGSLALRPFTAWPARRAQA